MPLNMLHYYYCYYVTDICLKSNLRPPSLPQGVGKQASHIVGMLSLSKDYIAMLSENRYPPGRSYLGEIVQLASGGGSTPSLQKNMTDD